MTLWEAEKNNPNGDVFQEILLNYDCLILNNKKPTHFCFNGNSVNILDYCIVSSNILDFFESFETLEKEDMTSCHVPLLIKFINNNKNESSSRNYTRNQRKIYNFKKADRRKFNELLPKAFPTGVGNNVDEINSFISESFMNAADISIPVYEIDNSHHISLPKSILELIKLRKKTKILQNVIKIQI